MAKCLRDLGHAMEFVAPLKIRDTIWLNSQRKLHRLFTGKRILREREPLALDDLARQVNRKLASINVDLVFCDSTLPLSHLETKLPVVLWIDAVFAGMLGFYPSFQKISNRSIRNGNEAEQLALEKTNLAFFTSGWSRQTCIENYVVDPNKLHVVMTGANLLGEPSANEVAAMIDSRPLEPCRLLFVGMDWERKNGDAAVALAGELNRHGLPTILTVIGKGPKKKWPDYVHFIGNLNKEKPYDQRTLSMFYAQSHFLLLPTRAEALGRVLMEATAYGVPCLVTDVGGTSSYIANNENGHLFPSDERFVPMAADYIMDVFASVDKYRNLARNAHSIYLTSGNWKVTGNKIQELLSRL